MPRLWADRRRTAVIGVRRRWLVDPSRVQQRWLRTGWRRLTHLGSSPLDSLVYCNIARKDGDRQMEDTMCADSAGSITIAVYNDSTRENCFRGG